MAERVEISSEIPGPDAPEPVVESAEEEERPEWLPEKFASASDMAQAYTELESKLGSTSDETDAGESEEATPEEIPEGLISTEAMEEFSTEFYDTGDLSPESLERLTKDFGIPEDISRAYVEGQKALVAQAQQSIYSEVGGQEAYEAMIEWAKSTMSESDIASYDSAIAASDMDTAKLMVKGLHAQYLSDVGTNPRLAQGSAAATAGSSGYQSWAQVTADMGKPEYKKDPAFRQEVQNRLAVSSL